MKLKRRSVARTTVSTTQTNGAPGAAVSFARLRVYSERHSGTRNTAPDAFDLTLDGSTAPLGVHAAIQIHISPGVSTKAAAAMLREAVKVVKRQRSLSQFFPAGF